MKLNEIGAPRGANRRPKRRGRGSGSGHGKTSGRGHKGALARTGTATRPGFEGGQMPMVRRLPKRGFNARAKRVFQAVNVESLNRFSKDASVGPEELKRSGLIGSAKRCVKILGDGKLNKVMTIKAHAFSKSAREKIASAGAKLEYIKC